MDERKSDSSLGVGTVEVMACGGLVGGCKDSAFTWRVKLGAVGEFRAQTSWDLTCVLKKSLFAVLRIDRGETVIQGKDDRSSQE